MADATHINAQIFTEAGATVGDSLERAAQPARVPTATAGASPADAAANAVAAAMQLKVTSASAELAPLAPKIRTASAQAAVKLTAIDDQNAARLEAISTMVQSADGATPLGPGGAAGAATGGGGAGRILSVSDGWDDPAEPYKLLPGYWEDDFGHFHNPIEEPIDPGGAAGGTGYGRAPV
jgi:hypothetical protein